MDWRRTRGILTQGVVAPAATVAVVVGAARLSGVDVGLAILGLSMVAAAALTLVLLSDTREMQPSTDEGGVDARDPVGIRSDLTETPDVPTGKGRVATRYTTGLFALAAFLVLYLGGLFG